MADEVSKYKNAFNEPSTTQSLHHVFDIMNDKNEDRIVFRDFTKHVEHVGVQLDSKALRRVYDHISSSIKKGRYITTKSWVKGIKIAHKESNTQMVYDAILSGKVYDYQPGREEIDMEEIRITLKETKAPWTYRVECMESFCRQITSPKLNKDKFHELFRQYHISVSSIHSFVYTSS